MITDTTLIAEGTSVTERHTASLTISPQFIDGDIGKYAHQIHQAAGQPHQQDLFRNAAVYVVLARMKRDARGLSLAEQQDNEIQSGEDIGKHGGNGGSGNFQPKQKNEVGIQKDIQYSAQSYAGACLG